MNAAAYRPGAMHEICNAMTVDVEDYFQVQALAEGFPRELWDEIPLRVDRNVDRVLDMFAAAGVRGTFFMLGWIAERQKVMTRRIAAAGHEIASHGYDHRQVDRLTPALFREDIRRTKKILEEIVGLPIRGYRAPTFSIGPENPWAFDILEEEGYTYSSSLYPISHDLYGSPGAPRFPFRPGQGKLLEIPMSTRPYWGRNFPCAGGGYFRLLPYWLSKRHLRQVNGIDKRPCIFYFHPWELDDSQPRPVRVPWRARVRHYTNLSRMSDRLRRLLCEFRWGRVDDAYSAYLNQ